MPSTYTTNLGIEKIATGEQSGTWGSTTNTNLDLLDQAVNGVEQVTLAAAGSSGSPNDLPITDGTASDGRNKFIEFIDGGDLGGTAYVQLTPNDAEKIVFLRNSLSASRSVIVFQGTYNASNDFEIPNGKDVVLKFDGAGASATVTQMFVDLKIDALDATTVASTNVNATTVDSTNVEVTNIKAKDGTASATIADSTGVMTIASAVLTTADINGGTADNVTIGGGTAAAGTFTTATATTGNITTVNATTVDTTNIEVTNVKAKDGTASATIADSTGVMTIASSVLTTADINGGTIDGVTIGGASAGAITGTTITGTSFVTSGDMTFGDNDKAIFGAGNDLQIYHDGTHSYISDQGTGRLKIFATDLEINNAGNTANYIQAFDGGAVQLFYNNAEKLATTATGIDVTGTITADGASLDGAVVINESGADVDFRIESATNSHMLFVDAGNSRVGIETASPTSKLQIAGMAAGEQALLIESPRNDALSNGLVRINITDSFCPFAGLQIDHAGTGAAIIANGKVGIGTTSPRGKVEIVGPASETSTLANAVTNAGLLIKPYSSSDWGLAFGSLTGQVQSIQGVDLGGSSSRSIAINALGGNVGIGTTSPASLLDVNGGASASIVTLSTTSGNPGARIHLLGSPSSFKNWAIGASAIAVNGALEFVPSTTNGGSTFTTPAMIITSTGNVGIGTTSPSQNLHVAGNTLFATSSGSIESLQEEVMLMLGTAHCIWASMEQPQEVQLMSLESWITPVILVQEQITQLNF
jgi:hypothetical protein